MPEQTPVRRQLREAVYTHLFAGQLTPPEINLLTDAGESETRHNIRNNSRPSFEYSDEVRTVLDKLGLKRLTDNPLRYQAIDLIKPLTDDLGFYTATMRLGLVVDSPVSSLKKLAQDIGFSPSTFRNREKQITQALKERTP